MDQAPNLEGIWKDQVERLVGLGFSRELGLGADEYRLSVPSPAWDAAAAAQGFRLVLLVEPRLSLRLQLKLGQIGNYLNLSAIEDREPRRRVPFWIHAQAGGRYRGKAVEACEAMFGPGERGLAVVEGVNLIIQYPQILESLWIDLPGSRYGGGQIPGLGHWYGAPGLAARPADVASPMYGSASCMTSDKRTGR